MEKHFTESISKLEATINELEIDAEGAPIQRIETIIDFILKCLLELKNMYEMLKNEKARGCKKFLFTYNAP